MRRARGFTLAETIVSIFILGLMFSAIAVLAAPIVNAPSAEAAKSDTVMSVAYGFDVVQRDIRQSDVVGIWACTKDTVVTCTQPTSLTATPYLAVLTANDSSGTFTLKSITGEPSWTAYVVYSQPTGSNVIYRTYQNWTTPSLSYQGRAVEAVTAASALPTGTTVAIPTAQSMSIAINTTTSQIDFQLIAAGGSNTSTNTTRYSTTVLARN